MASIRRHQEIAEQLRERVVSRMQLGLLKPGDKMPSVRESALEFDTDPRVVLAAYKLLDAEMLLELRNRSGAYVRNPQSQQRTVSQRADWIADILASALSQGVPPIAFAEHVSRAVETLHLRAVVMDCNDDQMFAIREELQTLFGMDAESLDLTKAYSGKRLARSVRMADVLVTTSAHAEAVAEVAENAGCSFLAVGADVDLFAEIARLLKNQRVYFVMSDVRFETKLRYMLGQQVSVRNLRTLVLNRDKVGKIPEDVALYVTRLAQIRMNNNDATDARFAALELPTARVLSDESALEVLRFVVSRNVAAAELRDKSPEMLPD